jgi:magnesium transporter
MLTVYRRLDNKIVAADDPAAALQDGSAVWADLLRPTPSEEKLVEVTFDIDAPTDEERAMLEYSARFYEENGALVLTATVISRGKDDKPQSGGVSFILTKSNTLVTVRTIEPFAFRVGQGRATARVDNAEDGADVFMALIEGLIERLADVMQEISARAQKVSDTVFSARYFGASDMRPALAELAHLGNLTTLGRDSLSSLERAFSFARHRCEAHGLPGDRLAALTRDAEQLNRQGDAMQDQLVFLLDGILGLVAANQNVALQRLSVAAMVLVPSTLIASIFGMNFEAMTIFKNPNGPLIAFAAMIAASAATFALARWRRWI